MLMASARIAAARRPWFYALMRDQKFSHRFAALHLASLICMSVCFAGSAAPEDSPLRSQPGMATLASTTLSPFFRPKGGSPPTRMRLDLRAPENMNATDAHASAPRGKALGTESEKTSTLRVPFAKSQSPAEAFVSRVHREGLPVARLWESKAALVSVGLNQKGQPGLWLIQKAH
jgi:hypothetical protein